MVRVYKVIDMRDETFLVDNGGLFHLAAALKVLAVGESVEVEVGEMERAAFDALPVGDAPEKRRLPSTAEQTGRVSTPATGRGELEADVSRGAGGEITTGPAAPVAPDSLPQAAKKDGK